MSTINTNGTGGGKWSSNATWSDGILPANTDDIIIESGDVLIIDGNYVAAKITNNGTLKASRSNNNSLANNYVGGGTVDYGTVSDPIPSTITAKLLLNNNRSTNAWTTSMGISTLTMISAKYRKRNTILSQPCLAKDNSIVVEDLTGWEVGDQLLLAPKYTISAPTNTNYEFAIIKSISKNTITLKAPLQYDHGYTEAKFKKIGAVSNMSSNVILSGQWDDRPLGKIASNIFYLENIAGEYMNNAGDYRAATIYSYRRPVGSVIVKNCGLQSNNSNGGSSESLITVWNQQNSSLNMHSILQGNCLFMHKKNGYGGSRAITFKDCQGQNDVLDTNTYTINGAQDGIVVNNSLVNFKNFRTFNAGSSATLEQSVGSNIESGQFAGSRNGLYANSLANKITDSSIYFCDTIAQAPTINTSQVIFKRLDAVNIKNNTFINKDSETFVKSFDEGGDLNAQKVVIAGGVLSRDTTVFKTKVASIKLEPNYDNIPLPYSFNFFVTANITYTIVFSIKITNYSSNANSSMAVVGSQTVIIDTTKTGWQTYNINYTPTASGNINFVLNSFGIGTILNIDDVFINGTAVDIGSKEFVGGTGVSTLIDIFDTALTIRNKNIIDGTRVQLYNITQGKEIDNSVVAGGNGYSYVTQPNASLNIGDIIRMRACWQSGTNAMLPIQVRAILTTKGIDFIDKQEPDVKHNQLGYDGSKIDKVNNPTSGELIADFTNIKIDVKDPNNIFDSRKAIAWWRYITTTAMGISYYDPSRLIYNPDVFNIVIDGNIQIKNIKNDILTITNGVWTKTNGKSMIDSSSNTIIWVPNNRVYTIEIGGSSLTNKEHNKLMSLENYNDTNIVQKLQDLIDIEKGEWFINNNQMIFYRIDGTEMMRFNLFDKYGEPSEVNIFKRELA